ncbi:PLDc N-terminal domain-containing protein [Roseobacteraceae bacterium NS-SX3]
MVEIAGLGGFILLVLTVWAIVSIVGSNASTGGKILWVLFVLLLPLIGFICWLLFGPRAAPRKA